MLRNKSQVPSKEISKTLTDKSSISRRDNTISKAKNKNNDDSGGSHNSMEEKLSFRRKLPDTSTTLSRNPARSPVPQKKDQRGTTDKGQEGLPRQSKPSTSKLSTVSQSVKEKSSSKSQSDSSVHSKNLKGQPKSSNSGKTAQTSRTRGNEPLRASRNSDMQKTVPERSVRSSKPTLPVKTSKSNSSHLNKYEKQTNQKPDKNGGGEGNRLNRERTKTRTLNPEDSQLMTALQHAAQQLPQDISPETPTEVENDYEDDFEDYESDFEEAPSLEGSSEEETEEELSKSANEDEEHDDDKENYDYGDSSSSLSDLPSNKDLIPPLNGKVGMEEKKMDSGHYDLSEERRLSGKTLTTILDTSRSLLEREHLPLKDISKKAEARTIINDRNSYEVKPINFAQAKKRQQERKASSKLKHRSEILLNMIHLDSVTFPLFEMAPVPYEIYMRSYGRSNTQQVSCQTNEDSMNEEVQTEEINLKNKWTQHPPAFVHPDVTLNNPLICGVGSDPCDADDIAAWKQVSNVDILELEKFVLNTGQLMLSVLEETSSGTQGILKNSKVDLGFSQGFIILGTESLPFLKDRPVLKLCFVPHQPNSVLSVHKSSPEVNLDDDLAAQVVRRCVLCSWSLLQPSKPLKILVSSSDVTACTFHPLRPHLLFAGLSDGILNVWDLKEQTEFQSKVLFQDEEWTLMSPSYATVDYAGTKHSSAVVGVQVLDGDGDGRTWELSPTQICSLDESGLCILWTVLSGSADASEDVGMAPWGRVRLLHNEAFTLAPRVAAALDDGVISSLQFADLAVDSADPGHLLAAINTGHAAHSLSSGSRAHPALYAPEWDGLSPATCICPCPFALPYFLVGCADGSVRLHSRHSSRPLLTVAASGASGAAGPPGGVLGSAPGVTALQWSNSRPCVFFALDCLSRLHVWDLAASDMFPVLTVPLKGRTVVAMRLSPSRHSAKACPYLALGTACGKLKVHLVSDAFSSTSLEDTAVELDKFKRYVSIL